MAQEYQIVIGNDTDTYDFDPFLAVDNPGKLTAEQEKQLIFNFIKLAIDTAYNSFLNRPSSSSGFTGGGNGDGSSFTSIMGSLELLFKESYKFIRMADDLNVIKDYLNDIRICFIALTVSIYFGILMFLLVNCIQRKRARDVEAVKNNKDDEALFGKWSGHRSASIRQPEFNHREAEENEIATAFYCPRPNGGRISMYSGHNVDRRLTKPLMTEIYSSHTPSPMTGSTVRENGGLGIGMGNIVPPPDSLTMSG